MNRIKELRQQKGFTQIEFSKELGIAQPTLSGWETGKSQIDYDNLKKLANYFSVSIDYLLGNSGVPFSADVIDYIHTEGRSEIEKKVIELLNSMPPEMQKAALAQLEALAALNKGDKNG